MPLVLGITFDVLWKAALFWGLVAILTMPDTRTRAELVTVMTIVTGVIFQNCGWWGLLVFFAFLALLVVKAFRARAVRPGPPAEVQPTRLYHGGPLHAVTDIYRNNRWLVGVSRAVWMTADFNVAKGYANKGGAIVELYVAPGVSLTKNWEGVYTAPVPHATPGRYYRIDGITPMRVLDTQGMQLAA
jgi:hypothetical protein